MAGLFERMGLVRTEYEGMPETPMQPVSEPMYAPETPVIDATQVSYDELSGFVARYPELEISPETVAVTALFHDLTKVNYYTVSSRNVKDDVTGAWHKEPFYKTEDRLPLGHGEKSVIILQSFIKLTRDEIVAIRWHMGSFDCAVKGGDYGMGNAFETYPLAVMTHLADMEATYLVEGLAAK